MAWSLSISTSESQNSGANQSTVSATLYLNWSSGEAYANYTQEWYISIGGNQTGGAAPTSVNWNGSSWVSLSGSVALGSHSVTFTHDANGNRSAVGTSGSFAGDGGYAPGALSVGGTTYGAINYDRKPATPAAPTAVVNSNKTITVSWSAVSSPAGTPTYYVRYAAALSGGGYGSWSSDVSTTSTSYIYSGLARGVTYKFQVRAENTDGTSAYSADSSGYFLPAGGKIYDAGSFRLTNFGRKFDGTNWVDLTTAKKFDGSTWVDLS